jgi:hypothetical protein
MPILGVCGDGCSECPRLAATRSGDRAQLAAVAALWLRVGLRQALPAPEEMVCNGCTPANRCAYAGQRDCVLQRAFSNCGDCPDYPCDIARRGLERSEALAARCRSACTPEEWEVLRKAFFRKRENLTAARG